MNWYIGQDIVCVDAKNDFKCATGVPPSIEEGKVYTINKLAKCICGKILIGVGDESKNTNSICKCQARIPNNGERWYDERRFRPLEELADISELTEVLETTNPIEV